MRCPPTDIPSEDVVKALDANWQLSIDTLSFVPKGAGAHHWAAMTEDGRRWFVTCDDLDAKPWLGSDRESVLVGLNAAYRAAHLAGASGLEFVVAPIPTVTGEPTTRLHDRHSIAVLPYIEGESGCWGVPLRPAERQQLLECLAELHNARLGDQVPLGRSTDIAGRKRLEAALGELETSWCGGPFSEPVRDELHAARELVTDWLREFDEMAFRLSTSTSPAAVTTHGEPHPGNVMRGTSGPLLIDWDTIAIDRPERDLWMLEDGTGSVAGEYERLTGRSVDPTALMLYRRAWALADLAAFVTQLRGAHDDDEDSRKAWNSITSLLKLEEPRPFGAPQS